VSRRDEWAGRRRPKRAAPRKRRGRAAAVVVGALALVGLGVVVGVVAVIFGVIPGIGIRRIGAARAADSVAVDSALAPGAAPAATDTATQSVTAVPVDSGGVAAAPGLVSPADSAAGETVYRGAGRCLSCHGTTGEGVAQLGPSLRDERWIVGDGSPAAIARAVRDGVSPPREFPIAMPAYAGQLPEEAIARVAAYVYALSHQGGVQRDSLAPRPDSARVPTPDVPPGAAPRPTVPRPTVPAPGAPR
jgi:mono/diheme cytochrome c family protein